MNASISSSGRVCLCEWSGPVTVTMAVSLLARLRQLELEQCSAVVLILHLHHSSTRSILRGSNTFHDVLPALWPQCQEIVVVGEGGPGSLDQLRRAFCGSTSAAAGVAIRPVNFFELLDDAFTHTQCLFPHDVLEMRRQRIRSGTWPTVDAQTRKCR